MTPRTPSTVAAVRGVLLWSALGAVLTALVAVTPLDLAGFGKWAGLLAIVIPALARWLEGVILDRNQPPQAGLLGGEPAAPVFDWATEAEG